MKKYLLLLPLLFLLSGCGYYYHHGYIRPYDYQYDRYYHHYYTYPRYNQWDYDNRRFKPTYPPQYNYPRYNHDDGHNYNPPPRYKHHHNSPPNLGKKHRGIKNNLNIKRVPIERYPNPRSAMPMR